MKIEFSASQDGRVATGVLDSKVAADVLGYLADIEPIVSASTVLDAMKAALDSEVADNRLRAVLAQETISKYHLEQALISILNAQALAEGRTTATELGFPEFEDDTSKEY